MSTWDFSINWSVTRLVLRAETRVFISYSGYKVCSCVASNPVTTTLISRGPEPTKVPRYAVCVQGVTTRANV